MFLVGKLGLARAPSVSSIAACPNRGEEIQDVHDNYVATRLIDKNPEDVVLKIFTTTE